MTPVQQELIRTKYVPLAIAGLRAIQDEYYRQVALLETKKEQYKRVAKFHKDSRQFMARLETRALQELAALAAATVTTPQSEVKET